MGIGAVLAAILVAIAAFVPSPFAIQEPGPVVDVFGTVSVDGEETRVIRAPEADTFPTEGRLNVLSVATIGTPDRPAGWFSLLDAVFDDSRSIVPLADLYPDGTSAEDRAELIDAQMRLSQQSAIAAALRQLDLSVQGVVTVASVVAGGPADGLLADGDVILAAGGERVSGVSELRRAVEAAAAEGAVPVVVERDGTRREVSVRAQPLGGGAGTDPMLGIGVTVEFDFPVRVELDLEDIGGPSAGLVFALGIYDRLTPGALTDGMTVSGTGTIDDGGGVGAIGALQQKIWGAAAAGTDLMLIPAANCAEVPDSLPDGLRIAPVSTLEEAISVLQSASNGGPVPGIERCDP